MSAPQTHAIHATARELLTLLAEHQRAVARMVAHWPDPAAYDLVAEQLDRMRVPCTTILGLSFAWADLLIAHAGLVQVLWRMPAGDPADEAALAEASAAHARAIARIESRVLWSLGSLMPG